MDEFGYHDLERSALGFVLEDERWPVFLAWCRANGTSPEIRAWLEAGPDLEKWRREYLRHSPEPVIRALADSPSSLRSLTTAAP
jgi:hypothetical protein